MSMFDCSVPDCEFSAGPEDLDDLQSVDGRGWWNARLFCPEHAKAIREGSLSRGAVCSTYTRKHNPECRTDFVQMDGRSNAVGFPPYVEDTCDISNSQMDDYHAEILLEGSCPHKGCGFRGMLLNYTGFNCPHMCPECGGIVHA